MEKTIALNDGRNVLVRDLRANEDVFELARWINEFVDEKAFISIDEKQSPEQEAAWLQRKISEIEKGETFHWCVFLNGKLVGFIEGRRGTLKEKDNCSFGIGLSREVRDQGLGRQLIQSAIKEMKKRWKPKNIYVEVVADNERAVALYKSCGFTEFARFPNWINHFGEYFDKLVLLLEEK